MTIVADLHMHTVESDGEDTIDNMVAKAKEQNLQTIAITDHDRIHSELTDPIQKIRGINVISGIELRVRVPEYNERVDILGYGVTESKILNEIIDEIQDNRVKRAEKMIELIENETGTQLDIAVNNTVGRPHIARVIDANDTIDYSYTGAFENLIGNTCPCYVSRQIPTFNEAYTALRDSSLFLSLAHPLRYDNPKGVIQQIGSKLDGIEYRYPYRNNNIEVTEEGIEMVRQTVEGSGLLATGGSDAHQRKDISSSGLDEEEFQQLIELSSLHKLF